MSLGSVSFSFHMLGAERAWTHLADAWRILVSVQRIPHCGWFWDILGWGFGRSGWFERSVSISLEGHRE